MASYFLDFNTSGVLSPSASGTFFGRPRPLTGLHLALSYREKEHSKRERERAARHRVEMQNGAKPRREG